MRIAMVTYLGKEGGVYTHIKNLASRISKFPGIELHIVVLSEKDNIEDRFGSKVHFIKRSKNKGANYIYNPFLIKRKIVEIDPDIVHIHQAFNYHSIAGILLKKPAIIVTIHQRITDEIVRRLPPSIERSIKLKIEGYLEGWLMRTSSYIIAPNPLIYESLDGEIESRKIYPISNGIDMIKIQESPQYDGFNHPCILYVGRLEYLKRVDLLLEATKIIKESIPDITTYIIGSGSQKEEFQDQVRLLNIDGNIKFIGFIPQDEIYSYYKSADIFVNPSQDGVFSLTTIEAMASGIPVITSNIYKNIHFLIEDGKTGLLSEYGNKSDLANKLLILLKNKELREIMGKSGQEIAKEYSWDQIASDTLKLYYKCI
jgi:glycosyltransferase involved in cell wall biosynthesis